MSIIDNEVMEYINSMQSYFDGKLGDIQRRALDSGYPIIPPVTARFLGFILSVTNPKNVLEIGCAVGFSASMISKYLEDGGHLITIDRHPFMIEQAKKNFEYMGITDKVTLLEGEAIDILPSLKGTFDFIFIDAAKGQYINFLPHCIRLLKTGGILAADNVLQNGNIAKDKSLIDRRKRTIHKRLRQFLWVISNTKGLESSIVTVGDGIAICKKTSDDIVL